MKKCRFVTTGPASLPMAKDHSVYVTNIHQKHEYRITKLIYFTRALMFANKILFFINPIAPLLLEANYLARGCLLCSKGLFVIYSGFLQQNLQRILNFD